jgi:hypothetical protein
MKDATAMVKNIPTESGAFATWKDGALQGLMSAKDQLTFTKPTAGQVLQADTARATNARAVSEGAANRAVTVRGQDLRATDAAAARAAVEKRGSGPGKMSATLQKELIESDDMAETSRTTIDTLKQALTINEKAYSGYGAKQRAQARAHIGKSSPEADNTIQLDNLIGTQALAGMKAIFGGNPTEGERAILLDLQASVDKTPKQRAEIIARAVKLAERRMKVNQMKASSIRRGTYLTEGTGVADDLADDLAQYPED